MGKSIGVIFLSNKYADIQSILDIEKWQLIQDKLAMVTNMAIITVDYKGIPVTQHSRCSEFCEKIRSESKTNAICQKCDARGGIEAVRLNQNYIYRCHCNIIDAAIPIIIDDKYFGCVMVGQVLLKENNEDEYIEKIYKDSIEVLSDQNEMLYLYSKLSRLTLTRIKEILDLIDNIIKYIVEECIVKFKLFKDNQDMKQRLEEILDKDVVHNNISLDNGETKERVYDPTNRTNDILKPAIEYINENFDKKIILDDMANMCFITPGYFSKIFYKETGEKFSDYLTRLKIEKAKELLKTTNKTIQEIAIEVGFNDAGYFTRRFKSYEGIAPGHYRKISKSQSIKYEIIKEVQNNTTI